MLLRLAIGFVTVLVAGWLLLAVAVARARPLPRSVRWKLAIALVYNVQPINLIPDIVPLIGIVDNLVITAWALRSALKTAGPGAVSRLWTGTSDGLAVLYRLLRLDPAERRQSSS